MAQLARLDIYVQDTAGNALNAASVEVRKQGAQIQTGGPTSFTVDDPGAIIAGDNTRINATAFPTRAVSSVAATNVTVAAGGFAGTVDDDRITVASPLPTIYADAIGNDTKTNPLTTDSNGYAFCWILGGKYDALVSGTGITTKLLTDQVAAGGENVRSNVYPSGSANAFIQDTLRTLSTGDHLGNLKNAGSSKFSIRYDGSFASSGDGTQTSSIGSPLQLDGAVNMALSLTVANSITTTGAGGTLTTSRGATIQAGGITVTGNSTIAGTLTGLSGLTSATGDIQATTGDVLMRRPKAGAGTGQGPNPTAALTFKDGTYASGFGPGVVVCRGGGSQKGVAFLVQSVTNTVLTLEFNGTPVAPETYDFSWIA